MQNKVKPVSHACIRHDVKQNKESMKNGAFLHHSSYLAMNLPATQADVINQQLKGV